MEFLIEHWRYLTTIGGIPGLLVIIKFCLDNFNIRNVEKKFMSNTKKVGIFISTGFISSSILFTFFFMLTSFDSSLPNYKSDMPRIGFFVMIFLSCSLIYMIIYSILLTLARFLKPKISYYVELSTNSEKKKWYIERKVGKDQMLLSDNFYSYKFYSEIETKNNEIKLDITQPSENKLNLYKYISNNKIRIIISLFVLFAILFLFGMNTNDLKLSIFSFLGIFLILILVVLILFVTRILKQLDLREEEKK